MYKLLTSIICLMIMCLSICFMLIPDVSFSENENRRLQEYPNFNINELIEGNYTSSLQKYLNEQFPFRNFFLKIRTFVYRGLNITNINKVYFADDEYLIAKSNGCSKCDNIIEKINNFNDNLDDIKLNLMIIPNAISIYKDKLPKNVVPYNQIEKINYVYENVNVENKINVYDTFMKNKDKYQLYYKTDHHYTLYGAYLSYVEYCKHNNLEYKELDEYEIEVISDKFSGTLASKVMDYRNIYDKIEIVNKDIDVDVYYADSDMTLNSLYNFAYLSRKNKYSIFLDSNRSLMIINRDSIKNDSKLLVIKDSYANSMIPFLVDNYSEIHVIDLRFYKDTSVSSYVKENKIDEVLIFYNFNTFVLGSLNALE